MKRSIKKKLLAAASLFLACTAGMQAQSVGMTGAVLTQPCNNNGVLSVTVTGLTPPINYTFTNYATSQTVVHSAVSTTTNNLTGIGAVQSPWGGNINIWYVTAFDGTSYASQSFTLTPPFTFYDSVNVAACPALSTIQAYFSGGTSPYTCAWTNQATSQVFTSNPASVPNGQYNIVATDGAGCVVSSPTFSGSIYVYSTSGITVNISGTSANCTNGTASATATGGTPPYTYLWSNGATSQNISGLSQGYYNCVVTDAVGCQTIGYYSVSQAVTLNCNTTVGNATCLQNNGTITTFVNGGVAPYTYLWSNAATTANQTGLPGGQYILQLTDANGCTGTKYVYVGVTTPIGVTYSTTASSCTAATGSATLTASGGTGPYTIIWYTFPTITTGTSISSKPSGSYSFKVTDANGCIQTGAVVIPNNSTINASLANYLVVCPATTGTVVASVSGSNPPFTYAWSNSATTSSISGVALGSYNCTITDAVGCSVSKFASVYQTSPINIGLSSTPVTCIYSSNGALTANATGGTSPYTYSWSNGQTGANATALTAGNYYVYATDANGCNGNSFAYVGNSASSNACYCTITGTVYADANNDCIRNPAENGIPNVQVHCSGLGYAYTNANGVYSFLAPTGTYTITESVQQIYPLAACQVNNQVVSVTAAANCSSTVNFANNTIAISDLHIITTSLNWPIPGNTYNQKVIVQNEGSTTESGIKLGYTTDGQLPFLSCTPWALTQQNAVTYPNWYSITSGFTSLAPGASSSSYINYNVPTNIPIYTQLIFNDTVARTAPIAASWLTDNTPWNNVDNHQALVVSSYDPNFKEVTPRGTGAQGYITTNDSVLTYVVHFQNTGSYYAENIVVTDSLDSDLNFSSLRPGYSDHVCTATMNENGVAKFTFKNINLAWQSSYGDVLSSGMFVYSVKLKKNLPVGTQIKNKAAIYFDYNEPVITNTTLNTIGAAGPTSVKELRAVSASDLLLFPNPANNYFTLVVKSTQNASGVLSVYDISGREVSTKNVDLQTGDNNVTENTAHLQSGVYFVQLKTANSSVSKKLIIAK